MEDGGWKVEDLGWRVKVDGGCWKVVDVQRGGGDVGWRVKVGK